MNFLKVVYGKMEEKSVNSSLVESVRVWFNWLYAISHELG